MDIKIRKNRKYKIIPEARMVICESQDYWISKEWDCIKKSVREIIKTAAGICGIHNGELYISKAFCDERDEFDEKIGMNIASEKTDYTRHLYYISYYKKMRKLLQEAIDECDALMMKHNEKATAIYDDMVKTYGWSEE